MPYGLLLTGFAPKPKEVIVSEINASLQAAYGSSINLDPKTSALGMLVDVVAEGYTELWELAEATANSLDRDMAQGAQLDSVGAITGVVRDPQRKSQVTLLLTGVPTTVVPIGSRAKTASTAIEFATKTAATITTTTAWAINTVYVPGDIRRTTVAAVNRIYICTIGGTSLGSGSGPSGTGSAIVDNTVTWRYVGDGLGHAPVAAEASLYGALAAAAFDITSIVTPVSGWTSVNNSSAAVLGNAVETDEDYRVRQEETLSADGTSIINGIRQAILDVSGVTHCTVFMNTTDVTDVDGVPPHSVEAVVLGGLDQAIADALLGSVAAGIGTHGTTTTSAVDSAGNSHVIKFTRPAQISIWVDIELIKNVKLYPSDGDAQVKAAVVAWGTAQDVGKDSVSSAIKGSCFAVPGVLDVTVGQIGTSNPPTTETTIVITSRQLAVYDVARVTVISTNGTP